jgi:hypothetical protein
MPDNPVTASEVNRSTKYVKNCSLLTKNILYNSSCCTQPIVKHSLRRTL